MVHGDKVSIIVPVYNVKNELNRCICSLIGQTYKNLEIILVDDGSTDGSSEICDEYKELDERIVTIHKVNEGLSCARNVGLYNSSGKYVMYVDSDDYIEKDACERFLSLIEDDADFVVGGCNIIKNGKKKVLCHRNIEQGKIYDAKSFTEKSIKHKEWDCYAVLNFYKREFLIHNNLFFKEKYLLEDMEFMPRLYLSARKIQYLDYPFYNYIIREGSLTTSNNIEDKRKYSILIYHDWLMAFSKIDDVEYKRVLNGALVNYFLWGCRAYKIRKWCVEGLDFRFAMKYSIGIMEKIKVIMFKIMPEIYINL